MKQQKTSKLISITAYLLIVLMGQMIGVPFFIWLFFTMLDFGNINQPYALLAILGLIINCVIINKNKTIYILLLDITCLLFMVSPIIKRLSDVEIKMFKYVGFIIPIIIFLLFYLISIGFSIRENWQQRKD